MSGIHYQLDVSVVPDLQPLQQALDVVLEYTANRHMYDQLSPNVSVARVKHVCKSLELVQEQLPKLQRVLKTHKDEHALVRTYSARCDAQIRGLNDWMALPDEIWKHVMWFLPRKYRWLRLVCTRFCNIYADLWFARVKLPAIIDAAPPKPTDRLKFPASIEYVFPPAKLNVCTARYLLSFVRARSHNTIKVRNPFNLSLSALWSAIRSMTVEKFPADLRRASFRELQELTVEFAGHTTIELPVPRDFSAPQLHTVVVSMAKGCRPLAAPKNTHSFFRGLKVPVVMSQSVYLRLQQACPTCTLCSSFGPRLISTADGVVLHQHTGK